MYVCLASVCLEGRWLKQYDKLRMSGRLGVAKYAICKWTYVWRLSGRLVVQNYDKLRMSARLGVAKYAVSLQMYMCLASFWKAASLGGRNYDKIRRSCGLYGFFTYGRLKIAVSLRKLLFENVHVLCFYVFSLVHNARIPNLPSNFRMSGVCLEGW